MSNLWVWISRATGLPKSVCKQDFQPTVGPRGTTIAQGDWIEFVPAEKLRAAEAVIEAARNMNRVYRARCGACVYGHDDACVCAQNTLDRQLSLEMIEIKLEAYDKAKLERKGGG